MQKVTMQDFEQIRCLSQVAFSPNGKAAAYGVSQPSLKENSYLSYIWVLEDGISRKLTAGGEESGFLWLDAQTLLFTSDSSLYTRYATMATSSRSARRIRGRYPLIFSNTDRIFSILQTFPIRIPIGISHYIIIFGELQ